MLAGGDTVKEQLLIVSGTGSMSIAKLWLRESTRVDDKEWLDNVSVGNWELMVREAVVRAEATTTWTAEGTIGVLSPPSLSSSSPLLLSVAGGFVMAGWKTCPP